MRKVVGIVCEGPRDYDMIRETVLRFTDQDILFLSIQPDNSISSPFGDGWKGVWRWCIENTGINSDYFYKINPHIDLLIIQIDADVARCEKEAYCKSISISCAGQLNEDPLNCSIAKTGSCPQTLPPNALCDGSINSRIEFLENVLKSGLCATDNAPVLFLVPCDSTDSWIIAALEESITEPETINDPWRTIIARGKFYHGVRIHGDKKSRDPYRQLIMQVCQNWDTVKKKCPQAAIFEEKVKVALA